MIHVHYFLLFDQSRWLNMEKVCCIKFSFLPDLSYDPFISMSANNPVWKSFWLGKCLCWNKGCFSKICMCMYRYSVHLSVWKYICGKFRLTWLYTATITLLQLSYSVSFPFSLLLSSLSFWCWCLAYLDVTNHLLFFCPVKVASLSSFSLAPHCIFYQPRSPLSWPLRLL